MKTILGFKVDTTIMIDSVETAFDKEAAIRRMSDVTAEIQKHLNYILQNSEESVEGDYMWKIVRVSRI